MQHDMFDDTTEQSSGSPSAEEKPPHTLAASILQFDLDGEAELLRRQDSYAQGRPTGRTLVKEPDLRIVLMTLKAGGRMEEHDASGPISIQPLDGTIRLQLPGRSVELKAGQLLMLEAGMRHDVDAVSDAAFLLTIGRTRYQQVSDHHERHP